MAELYDLEAGDHAHDAGPTAWTRSRRCSTTSARWCPPASASTSRSPPSSARRRTWCRTRRCPTSSTWAAPRCCLGPAFDAAHRGVDVLEPRRALRRLAGPAGRRARAAHRLRTRRRRRSSRRGDRRARPRGVRRLLRAATPQRAAEEASRSIRLQATLLLALGAVVAIGGLVLDHPGAAPPARGRSRRAALARRARRPPDRARCGSPP